MKSSYTSVPKRDFFFPPRKRDVLDIVLKESHSQVIPIAISVRAYVILLTRRRFYRPEVFCLMNQDNRNNQDLWVCIRRGRRPEHTQPFGDSCLSML